MAQTNPTPYQPSAAPTVPDRTNRTGFAAQMFAFFTWMAQNTAGGLYYGLTNLATVTYNNAVDAFNNATLAQTYGSAATGAANVFGTSTNTITPVVTAAQAITYATGGSAAVAGMRVRFSSRANTATNWGEGVIASNTSGTLSINVDTVGSLPAAASDWNVFLVGQPGVGATLQTAKVTFTTSGTLVRSNAGAQVVSTNAAAVALDRAALLGNGWAVTFPQRGASFPITLTVNNAETINVSGGTTTGAPGTVVVPAGVAASLYCDGANFTLCLLGTVPATLGAPGTANVLNATAGLAHAICALTTTRGLTTYYNGTNTICALVDNTGASLGTAVVAAVAANAHCLVPIDSTRALFVMGSVAGLLKAYIISFSGTVVTVGSAVDLGTLFSMSGTYAANATILPGSSKAIVAYVDTTTSPTYKATVLTIGAGTTLSSTNSTQYTYASLNAGSTPYHVRVCGFSTTQALTIGYNTAVVVAESAGVLTFTAMTTTTTPGIPWNGSGATTSDMVSPQTGRIVASWGNFSQFSRLAVSDFISLAAGFYSGPFTVAGDVATCGTSGHGVAQRLLRINAESYVHLYGPSPSTKGVCAEILQVRDMGFARGQSAQAAFLCDFVSGPYQFDGAVFGSTLLCVYADSLNSNFNTIRAIPIYGA